MRTSVKILCIVLAVLFIATACVWYAALRADHRGTLTVSFLNVGQGNAILITAPNGRQVLVDGGPDNSVLRQLGGVMPFYDRSLDLVIATAPTPQDVGGLAGVLQRYRVAGIVRSAAHSSAPQAQAFTAAVATAEQDGARLSIVKRGNVLDLGSNGFIEIFFPDRDASQMAPSDGCLMFKLVFGDTSFFFACGSPALETYLATLDGPKLNSTVLLAMGQEPELFLGFVSPQEAIVPCGSNATSSAFAALGVEVLNTCEGTVTFVSDGQNVTRE